MVYQIAYSVLRNTGDAEDVAQETFVRAHAKLAQLRRPEKFRTWVSQISRRLALNRLRADARARKRERAASESYEPGAIDIEGVALDRDFVARVCCEIDRLPQKLREVMLLTAVAGLDHAAAARILKIPEGTVRSRLHSARKQLLQVMR